MRGTEAILAIIGKHEATNGECQDGVKRCWAELSDALTEDIGVTWKLPLEECAADEISWVSEVYDDTVCRTWNRECIDLFHKSIS